MMTLLAWVSYCQWEEVINIVNKFESDLNFPKPGVGVKQNKLIEESKRQRL